MNYFENVKRGDEVYSVVYGEGKVKFVLNKKLRSEGFYMFMVEFNSDSVYYTEDGIPEWCSDMGNCITIYYKDDLNKPELDFKTHDEDILSKKKIAKLKEQGKLEMRVPTGAWRNVDSCPTKVFLEALRDGRFHLFRKEQAE